MRNFILIVGLVWCSCWVLADGGMFIRDLGPTTPLVSSPAQEALMVRHGEEVTVVLRTHFLAGPSEVAWLVPVPAAPQSVKPAGDEVFKRLGELTAPRFFSVHSSKSMFSCGCAAPMASGEALAPVAVLSSGNAGVFAYHTLTAKEPGALIDWLNENGYRVPEMTAAILQPYVDRGFAWIAMRIRPEETGQATLAPHPIVYTYRSDKLVFPMIISRVSAAVETEVILYVAGGSRFRAANWSNATIEEFEVRRASTPSGTNYEELIREKCATEPHLFVAEYSSERGGRLVNDLKIEGAGLDAGSKTVLTRLRGLVRREAMDRDVELMPIEGEREINNGWYLHGSAGSRWDIMTPTALAVAVGVMYVPRVVRGRRRR